MGRKDYQLGKIEYMVVSKRNNLRCKLQHEDVKIKQEEKCSYLGSALTDGLNCDTEIRRYIGIMKDDFKKLSKI